MIPCFMLLFTGANKLPEIDIMTISAVQQVIDIHPQDSSNVQSQLTDISGNVAKVETESS